MAGTEPELSEHPERGETVFTWTGNDARGRELEVVAIERPDCFLVIHVMPTSFRERGGEAQ